MQKSESADTPEKALLPANCSRGGAIADTSRGLMTNEKENQAKGNKRKEVGIGLLEFKS